MMDSYPVMKLEGLVVVVVVVCTTVAFPLSLSVG